MKLSNVATKEIILLDANDFADMVKSSKRFTMAAYVGSLVNHRARTIHVFFEYDINTASVQASVDLFKTLWAASWCSEKRDADNTVIVLHDPVVDFSQIPICRDILAQNDRRLVIDRAMETRIIRNEKETVIFRYEETETGMICKAKKEIKR